MEIIKVNNVWKNFKIYHDKGQTLKEKVLFRNQNKYEKREVLKGINLSINKGEVVGLIGENGSGKSTLLKLLTKIIYPDQGEINIKGKISSLLELGAGFHPDMSGRENIYTNASIFGLTRKEIEYRMDDIISFSELEKFIDNPVRTYSSGMYMRLAFSVAINVNAQILLVDEILAVGDANFQAKCFEKMQKLKKRRTTIIIVSHDLGSIEELCDKSIWIDDGNVRAIGEPYDVNSKYLDFMEAKRNHLQEKSKSDRKNKEINMDNNEKNSNKKKQIRWGYDWHKLEKYDKGSYRWMSKKISSIYLKSLKANPQAIKIEYMNKLSLENGETINLKIRLNDKIVKRLTCKAGTHIETVPISVDIRKNEIIEVSFEVNKMWRPSEVSNNSDHRDLGIALCNAFFINGND